MTREGLLNTSQGVPGTASEGLPDIAKVDMKAPFRWLAGGWSYLWKAPGPCLMYGLLVALLSFAIAYALVESDAEFWALALTCGFVFVAPMIAMGLYQRGILERSARFIVRLAVAFVLGTVAMALIFYAFPATFTGRGVLALSLVIALGSTTQATTSPSQRSTQARKRLPR